MQKQDEVESILYELNQSTISNQFLDIQHYKHTQQNNRRGSLFYQSLCTEIQNNYRIIIQLPSKGSSLLQINNHLEKWQIRKFKSFLEKMFEIFNLVSEFQIDGLSKLRSSKDFEDNNENIFSLLTTNVQRFHSEQQKLGELRKQYQFLLSLLQAKQEEIKNKLKKPEHYFNIKYISAQLQVIEEKLSRKNQIQTQISELIQVVSKNSLSFQKDLMFYRQRLVMNKYQYIQKISRLTKNSKQSLVQIFTYLYQYIENQKSTFTINKLQPENLPTVNRKMERSKLTQLIVSHTNNYNIVIDEYVRILNGLINYFTDIGKQLKDVKSKQIQLIQSMNKYYENGECEILQVKLVLNLFNSFLKQLSELGDKLVFSLNTFLQLKNKINKSSEMTLTLTKCSQRKLSPPHSRRQFVYQYKEQQSTDQYIKLLHQQMSDIYIQNILLKIYNDFRDVTVKIRDQFLVSQPNKRKKIDNSMSISYITEINTPIQKRPAKKQLWLWKNWRVNIQNVFQNTESIIAIKNQFLELVSQEKEEQKEIQQYNCFLKNKKLKGILKLNTKSLVYQPNNNTMLLFLPFNQIQSLDIQLNMISKTLNVQTNVGFLYFSQDSDGDIKKFFINTQKAIDSYNQHNNQQQQVQQKVALSEQQIAFIKKRKVQIEPNLQNLKQYEHFNTLRLQDIDIVDFYRVIYSGEPVVIHGKEYPNFSSSLMKKYKNFNQIYTPYDKPVPFYYSKIQGTTFFNCSLYSERVIQYDHYLPKVPIFPETCHNKQTVRVFWVSNQQFHVRQTNNSSKAPFTQNFIIVMLITINQIEKDLEVKFYMKLIVLKDFTFKKLVLEKATQQAKWGCDILIEQIKKVMAKYKQKQHKNQKIDEKIDIQDKSFNSNRTQIRQYKTTIKNLQNKNKILMYILGLVLIFNILFKLYF